VESPNAKIDEMVKKITKRAAMKKGNMNKKAAPEQDNQVDSYVV
jgi:hypothetical protein